MISVWLKYGIDGIPRMIDDDRPRECGGHSVVRQTQSARLVFVVDFSNVIPHCVDIVSSMYICTYIHINNIQYIYIHIHVYTYIAYIYIYVYIHTYELSENSVVS